MQILKAALAYKNQCNFSVIPVGATKKPLIKWVEYQSRIASDEEITQWWQDNPTANIGIVTGRISNLSVIDIDTAEGKEAIQQYIPDSLLMPCATTPRGGQHMYFRMPEQEIRNNTRVIPGCDLRAEGGYVLAPPSKLPNGNYKWVDSLKPGKIEIPALPDIYIQYITNSNNSNKGGCGGDFGEKVESCGNDAINLFSEGRRDNDLFHIAHLMAKGGSNPAETLKTLEVVASTWGEGHLKDWLNAKVESAFARLARKEINISDEVKRYIALSNGYFSVTDCYEVLQALQSVTSVTERYKLRTAVRVDLHREKEKGHIAPDTKRNGYFIRIDDVCEDMDIINVSTEAHPLALPVGLRDLVKIMPKNICIIAGAKSSGKTAFLLNTAWLNRDNPEGVYYYNSEMAAEELRGRLDDFNDFDFPQHSLAEWQKVKFKERTQNFADIIKQKPNAIHIVDFLEIYEDFYAIGRYIREIHDALDKGVAIIALQKNANTDLGLGGARSIEKARLYLSLDRGVMKITDAKLFAIKGVNPRGFVLNYKLLNGCHYFPDDWGWHEVNEKGEKVKF